MALRPPSNQSNRDDFWSRDPAFIQLPDNATEAQGAAHALKWRVARETGNFGELLVEGASPTKFVMRPIPGNIIRKLIDKCSAGQLGDLELAALAFRCALVEVSNFGDTKIKHVNTEDFGRIASQSIVDELDEVAKGAVNELGSEAIQRATGLSGK